MSANPNPRRPPKATAAPPARRVGLIVAVVVGLVVIVVGGILAASLGGDDDDEASGPIDGAIEYGDVQITGDPLPTFPGADDPAVGTAAPVLSSTDFAGRPTSVGGAGDPTMVLFMAHWCPHCNAEADRLADYLGSHEMPAGVSLVVVPTGSTDTRENWPPSQWVVDKGIDELPMVLDDQAQDAALAYGLSSYPFIVLLDADGNVLQRFEGEQPEGFFAQALDQLAATVQA